MPEPFEAAFPPRSTGRLAITHASVVPMDAERVLPDQTILVEDGVIVGMGPSASVAVGEARVIDAAGRFVLPGLADMHIHYADVNVAGVLLANGVTRVRNMWGSPTHLALRKKVRDGAMPGPWVTTTSPIVDGLGTHGQAAWPNSLVLTDPARAEGLVAAFARRGYEQVKGYQWLQPAALRALGDAARTHGLRLVGHCPEDVTFEDAMAAGMSCFEHLTGVGTGHLTGGRQMPSLRDPVSRRGTPETLDLVAHHLDPDAIERLADRMAREQCWTCPTLVVWQKQVQLPEDAVADPALRYETPGTANGWAGGLRGRHAQLRMPVAEWLALSRARDAALAGVVRTLHAAGAPILLGTDAPNPFVVAGFAIHLELANLVAAGLSPFAAIRAGTSDAARFLDEQDVWGSVAIGQRADLIFAADNPLASIGTLREPAALLVNGWFFDRAALDRLLEARLQHVSGMPEMPPEPGRLSSPLAGATVEQEHAFVELMGGVPSGRLRSRSQRLDDGRRLIDERHVGRGGARWQERSVRLWTGLDGALERGEVETTSWLGDERIVVERTSDGYRASLQTLDGVRSDSALETRALRPSERLSATALAGALREAGTLELLSVDDEALQVVTARVSSAGGDSFEVAFERAGTVTLQTYQLDSDDNLQRLAATAWFQTYELRREDASENENENENAG